MRSICAQSYRALVVALVSVTAACDPCAGTPSCHGVPEMSYTGQFIERNSGKPVAGVRVLFVRHRGAIVSDKGIAGQDTIETVSDGDGFFVLRATTYTAGFILGDLHVIPPAPYPPYTITRFIVKTSSTRANGGILGRLVVDPYMVMIGEVRDRNSDLPVGSAIVRLTHLANGSLDPDSGTFVTAPNGRFEFAPKVVEYGDAQWQFDVTPPGYNRTFHIHRTLPPSYRDEPPAPVILKLGHRVGYVGETLRRGTGEHFAGVTAQFVRRSGLAILPDSFVSNVDAEGRFNLSPDPLGDGTVVGDLTIRPPSPFPPETISIALPAFDDDTTILAGRFGYGPAVFFKVALRYRATALPLEEAIQTRITRVSGLTLVPPQQLAVPDSGLRSTDTLGVAAYSAATATTGFVTFDLEVRLPKPHAWETIRGLKVPAAYRDNAGLETAATIGLWVPWQGELRDANTNAPVAGMRVELLWRSGAKVAENPYVTTSANDGSFPLHPLPQTAGTFTADLRVMGGASYRDTVVTGLQFSTSQSDTVRSLNTIKLTRLP